MTDSPSSDSLPRWLWPLLLGGAILILVALASLVLIIASGATDPPVAGPVVWRDDVLAWAGESPLALDPGVGEWYAAPGQAALPADRAFTLTVAARLDADSAPGAAWGVWIAEPDGSRVVWAMRGDGYLTIRRCPAAAPAAPLEDCPALIPDWGWHFYPRILAPGHTNRLTLHREPDGIRLRINHEILGIARLDLAGDWGVWTCGDSRTSATLRWESAELRAADVARGS